MSDEGFRVLVENAPDGIVVSRRGIVLYANAAAATLLGRADASDLIGKPMAFLDEGALRVMQQRIERMMRTGERLVPHEYPAHRQDGTEITAEVASSLIEFDGGPAVLAYVRDVTDRAKLRARLVQADRVTSIATMAAGVAHEINNPLAVTTLAVDVLARRVHSEDAQLVEQVRSGVDRIAAIVRELGLVFGGQAPSDEVLSAPSEAKTAQDGAVGLRVLVVDDEPLIVRSVTAMLRRQMIVVGETDSARALELILEGPGFDVIVCDIMMPGLTGADLHERVAKERPGHEVRFVFITGGAYTASASAYFERIPNLRLMKPFKPAELILAIERVAARGG
jgi:PAS domain S-box-containing protein